MISKSTLYKDFCDLKLLKEINVDIIDDPFEMLERYLINKNDVSNYEKVVVQSRVYLPLYSYNKKQNKKVVEEKSGLNLRFASGRKRSIYEVYIPIPKEFRKKYSGFFPERETPFDLYLPNGKIVSAKICQDDGKALMTNPNSELGKWLIDDVFKINKDKLITFELINRYGIDSVVIEKRWNIVESKRYYAINFAKTDSYERFIGRISNIEEEQF